MNEGSSEILRSLISKNSNIGTMEGHYIAKNIEM